MNDRGREITQQAISQSVVRHLPQLFFDIAKHVGRSATSGRLEAQRIHRGKPPNGAGHVDMRPQIGSAMALDINKHRSIAGPTGQRERQRRQQDLRCLAVIGGTEIAKKRVGLFA